MESNREIERHEYFTPGEVCFFFEHDPKEAVNIDELRSKNKEVWNVIEGMSSRCLDVQTFGGGEGDETAYSLVSAQMPIPRILDSAQRRKLNHEVIRLIDETFEGIQRGRFTDSLLRLASVTPNWFSGAAQHIIDGGPGAQPVDGKLTQNDLMPLQVQAVEEYINQRLIAQKSYEPREVDVYVLDSIPLAESWMHLVRMQDRPKTLMSLLEKLTITTAAELGTTLPDEHYEIAGHTYEMSDHGLFIAGLIHGQAPEAKIHLLEVLNRFGVGTMKSLLAGLEAIKNIKRPTIINCSLMMGPQSSALIEKFPDWERMAQAEPAAETQRFTSKQMRMPVNEYLAAMMQPVEKIIAQRVAALGGSEWVKIVASAGNDSRGDRVRKPARRPAAFANVIGIAALDNNNRHASYSNYADNPLNEGMAAFGGVADINTNTTDPVHGIASLYIGKLPDGSWTNGMARWAGTSFAAGVVSGLLAKLVSAGETCDNAEQFLRNLRSFDVPDIVT